MVIALPVSSADHAARATLTRFRRQADVGQKAGAPGTDPLTLHTRNAILRAGRPHHNPSP